MKNLQVITNFYKIIWTKTHCKINDYFFASKLLNYQHFTQSYHTKDINYSFFRPLYNLIKRFKTKLCNTISLDFIKMPLKISFSIFFFHLTRFWVNIWLSLLVRWFAWINNLPLMKVFLFHEIIQAVQLTIFSIIWKI